MYKYITIGNDIVIFPKTISHKDMSKSLSHLGEVEGAGFTDFKKCYGKSDTLGIKSRDKDSFLLEMNSRI